jgi:hypothetical protein
MKTSISCMLMLVAVGGLAACDPEPDSLTLRQLNSGPVGSALYFDSYEQRANIAVGTALAFDCNEYVQESYRAQCSSLTVESNSPAVTIRRVYRPRSDGSVATTTAFAIVGMAPGTAQLQVRTAANEYTLTVAVAP